MSTIVLPWQGLYALDPHLGPLRLSSAQDPPRDATSRMCDGQVTPPRPAGAAASGDAPVGRSAAHHPETGEAAHVGAWRYDQEVAGSLGFERTEAWSPDALGFRVRIDLVGDVRFPADEPRATSPDRLSARTASCGAIVVIPQHRAGLDTDIALLDALARYGFVAARIALPAGITAFEQADILFEHLLVVQRAFAGRLHSSIGLLGLGGGADAVFEIARLNRELGIGLDITAAMAMGRGRRIDVTQVLSTVVPVFRRHLMRDGDAPPR
jgi:hypothetical protein